jgi:plasmid stabilization system protein ParE
MIYQVIIAARASRAIQQHIDWWARERSANQARRWYKGIKKAIASLKKSPERCNLAAEHEEFPFELRELHFGLGARPLHRIVFTILEEQVIAVAVRHTSQRSLQIGDIEFH